MALSDYQPERREVIVNGKPLFSVEGLSFDGLEKLVRTHVADMEGIFDLILVGEKPGDTLNASLANLALALVTKAQASPPTSSPSPRARQSPSS